MTWRAMCSCHSILALCAPLALILSIASKVYELQEDDEALVQEEKWKMTIDGRGLHSFTSQLNLSRFLHKIHPEHPLILLNTP
jgi:hypothetical protein